MITNIEGLFYGKPKLEIVYLDKADVSAAAYEAKKLKHTNGVLSVDDEAGILLPFYVCHPQSLQMKVETWHGQVVENWIFEAGKDPIPLRKIYANPAPVLVELGTVTETEVTNIQVGY